MWVLDHLEDLESDFSVFHRVDDIYALPARRFFALAERIFAYDGVLAKRAMAESAQERDRVPSTAEEIGASELGPYVSVAKV